MPLAPRPLLQCIAGYMNRLHARRTSWNFRTSWNKTSQLTQSSRRESHPSSQMLGQIADLREQPLEAREVERLRAVGERMVGIGMNLDHEAVGAGGQRGQGHGGNIFALARAVAGVDEDGQVREL